MKFSVATTLLICLMQLGTCLSAPRGNEGGGATKNCRCYASGDPHYTSCDGLTFDFMGRCEYDFAKVCHLPEGSGLQKFRITETNEECYGSSPAKQRTCVKEVTVRVYGYKIELFRNGQFRVDGVKVFDSWKSSAVNPNVRIRRQGRYVIVETDFGLRVEFAYWSIDVTIPKVYSGYICGLCGNFNGHQKDDFTTEDGVDVMMRYQLPAGKDKAASDFGNRYLVPNPNSTDEQCRGNCHPDGELGDCIGDERKKAEKDCKPLIDTQGVFGRCVAQNKLDGVARVLYEACIFDRCRNADLCTTYKNFVDKCGNAFSFSQWRKKLNCELDCGKNAVYAEETSLCPNTCKDPDANATCDTDEKVEGCECKRNFLMEDGVCIHKNQCGCTSSCGGYMKLNDIILTKDCKFQRECKRRPGGNGVCEVPYTCYGNCSLIGGRWLCNHVPN